MALGFECLKPKNQKKLTSILRLYYYQLKTEIAGRDLEIHSRKLIFGFFEPLWQTTIILKPLCWYRNFSKIGGGLMLDIMVFDPSLYHLIKAFVGYCKNSVIATKTKSHANQIIMHYSTRIKIYMGNCNNKTVVKTILEWIKFWWKSTTYQLAL